MHKTFTIGPLKKELVFSKILTLIAIKKKDLSFKPLLKWKLNPLVEMGLRFHQFILVGS
jgi:hypothetical protein